MISMQFSQFLYFLPVFKLFKLFFLFHKHKFPLIWLLMMKTFFPETTTNKYQISFWISLKFETFFIICFSGSIWGFCVLLATTGSLDWNSPESFHIVFLFSFRYNIKFCGAKILSGKFNASGKLYLNYAIIIQ